jgi:protoporphyrinogen oxidase
MAARQERAIIIGAGPAGLTAAYELLQRTDIKPIILESTADVGGISKTVNYKGNRIDIGGHRFFSKSDRVMQWWQSIMPIQANPAHGTASGPDPEDTDLLLLIRSRLSRILFLRKLFDYPITLSLHTVRNLGFVRILKIALSYASICLLPKRAEQSLEDFFINRFGRELYRTFFRDYTEKVWGVPCNKIKPEWGAQRVKGLSITKSIAHAIKKMLPRERSIEQKNTETTLIEQFLYPKFGPGQMWEAVADRIREMGGEFKFDHTVVGLTVENERMVEVEIQGPGKAEPESMAGEYFFSTMPVRDLILTMKGTVPAEVKEVSKGLVYRDFITVGLLLKSMIAGEVCGDNGKALLLDNWIYIQESDVKVGRLQIFNNWSPYMVANPRNAWIGLEYFCNEGDDLWTMEDTPLASFAIGEMVKIGMIDKDAVLDWTVIRMPKAYPAYFGSYDRLQEIRDYSDRIDNLYLIGRNGMHKYNNQDHSMLTAMTAVDNIVQGIKSKENIWAVNVEDEYHESK